jgi:hypothetical protein
MRLKIRGTENNKRRLHLGEVVDDGRDRLGERPSTRRIEKQAVQLARLAEAVRPRQERQRPSSLAIGKIWCTALTLLVML